MVAFRYLRARRGEGFIAVTVTFSVLGILLAVASLVVVMAVMKGFRLELVDRILGINPHIALVAPHDTIPDYDDLSGKLLTIPGITYAMPAIEGQVLATANKANAGAHVRALRMNDVARLPLVATHITSGSIEDMGEDGVLIGVRMAATLHLKAGDAIRLLSPQTTETIFASIPRMKDYRVAGVFEVGMFEYDSSTIFMPLAAAQVYFKLPDSVTSIGMGVADRDHVEKYRDAIMAAAGQRYFLADWKQANGDFVHALDVERSAMFLILALIMCVAGFMILSGMWMLVVSKRREIAILRTMGASRMAVQRIFLMCGMIIGTSGTALGLLAGVGFATHIQSIRHWLETTFDTSLFPAAVYFLTTVPAQVQMEDVLHIVALAMGITLLATIFPARKAASIPPAEGLRYE